MAKSHTKIYIHYIWATKNRRRILVKDIRERVKKHIRESCQKNGIFVLEIDGDLDHLHLLVDLPPTKSVADAINLIKGESSHWINESNLFRGKFHWQKRYGAFSVSGSQVRLVQIYIRKQELHHKKVTFQEELENFHRGYGLEPKEIDW